MIQSISEDDTAKVACPECKKENVRRLVTTFAAKTRRKKPGCPRGPLSVARRVMQLYGKGQ